LQFPVPKPTALIAGLFVALLLAACSAGTQAVGGDTSEGGGPTIAIATPADGAEVSVPFDVHLESNVQLGAPETGNHHAHLYFDTNTDSADYDIVYGNRWQVTRTLGPGRHTITVALANPDHSLAGPTQTISVTIGGAAPDGEPSQPIGSPPPAIEY
jgi:hypothetical protein